MLEYLSADIICSQKRTVFRGRCSTEYCELRGTDNVQGQMSEQIFAPNGGYCVYHPSNLFRNVSSFENWGICKLGYLSADIVCSEKRTVFRERSLRKTLSFEEQIMSKDKCPNLFLRQMGVIVFITLQIFATRAVFKIGE